MANQESASKDLKKAIEIIASCQGKPLSHEERERAAIDLAVAILNEANRTITFSEKRVQAELSRMMRDSVGKVFTMAMTDQCFRSRSFSRIANQMVYLLGQMGVPRYLSLFKRVSLFVFQHLGKRFPWIFVPLAMLFLRKSTQSVILPGERGPLKKHMAKRRLQNVRLNLNHLGEAILGEKEARRRLDIYLHDLAQEDIEYVSVKISTIYSQIHMIGWDGSLEALSEKLRELYRASMQYKFKRADGSEAAKFVNLDMEEYKDLHLTKDLFKKVLDEPEFLSLSAGIVLQAYLPDSFTIQKELTDWAIERMKKGGAPIKIRVVKGANLAMEQCEASARGWHQAPYTSKAEVDANYKQMVLYGCAKEHAKAVHLGVASHNLFDIAYALLLRAEQGVETEVNFEMLEGMADHMRRVVQLLSSDILLYCPVATKQDFQSAIAYLIRRLDENTGPDNFLRQAFGLRPGMPEWDSQVDLFSKACSESETVAIEPRRQQDQHQVPQVLKVSDPFENEADTDFALPQNRKWAEEIAARWHHKKIEAIPLVIAGKEIQEQNPSGEGVDPAYPGQPSYRYSQATKEQVQMAIACAKEQEKSWSALSLQERCELFAAIAQKVRENRGDLIGVMMLDGGKTILEADPEVSEAIDFAEYYFRSLQEMHSYEHLQWSAKGTILVTPPWNFPIAIPLGGILAALAAGNCVLFKPAPEAVLSGWELVKLLWEAGVPKQVLQFINCVDDPVGSSLICDERVNGIILTGASSTAKLFLEMRPGLDLHAETGGKNGIIVTALADRDLVLKDVIASAFGHSGQKCSACSLLVLEKEVYDDPRFFQQLKDAVESLQVGTCWDLKSKITPLIRPPGDTLMKGLTQLDKGEKWLVEPKQDPDNPHLWSPGVKIGVKRGSYSHKTEFFGPVLSVVRAKNLEEAIEIVNDTPYGLTSGLQTLDEREKAIWKEKIEAGNCYVNRTTTGAIVRRQAFGGTKASCFGGGAKAGGPNYLQQFTHCTEVGLPHETDPLPESLNQLSSLIEKFSLSKEEVGVWYASLSNYAHFAKVFAEDQDLSQIVGQDNLFCYRPLKNVCLRVQPLDKPIDFLRVVAAALSVGMELTVSYERDDLRGLLRPFEPLIRTVYESEEAFNKRVAEKAFSRVRVVSEPSKDLIQAASSAVIYLDYAVPLAHARFELLHYLREVSFSMDYHRYGNLGAREKEKRKDVL